MKLNKSYNKSYDEGSKNLDIFLVAEKKKAHFW